MGYITCVYHRAIKYTQSAILVSLFCFSVSKMPYLHVDVVFPLISTWNVAVIDAVLTFGFSQRGWVVLLVNNALKLSGDQE